MVDRSEVRYAVADGHHIAFRVLTGDGEDGHDIVMVSGGVFPMDSFPADPVSNRLLDGLAAMGRLVVFDKRGIGLSDQIADWGPPLPSQWEEDLAAVIDAAGLEAPVIFSWVGRPVGRRYAMRHPDRVSKLILWNAITQTDASEIELEAIDAMNAKALDGPVLSEAFFPERWKDAVFRDWHDAAGRAGASPGQAAKLIARRPDDWDGVDHAAVAVPTLVIARTPPALRILLPDGYFCRAAELIPGATLVDLGTGGMNPIGADVDDVLAEVTRFVTGTVRVPAQERSLAAVLFTDLVGSTQRATEVGDTHWKVLLDRHDEISATAIRRQQGELVKTTGDGVLALFGSATAAIRAAKEINRELATVQLSVRAGVHVGQIDRRGSDVSGLALNIAARIMAVAEGAQILVSDVVERITDDVSFAAVGDRELKDLEGTWELFEVS